MFRVLTADFVIGAATARQFPSTDLPEVAFAGRSNVGKSSLLNTLCNRKNLAKTSGTPGKTRQINFFLINSALHFVDLPGYGYAKVSKEERDAWMRVIDRYVSDREQLRLVVALADIRHEPSPLDRTLFQWLDSVERPYVVVLTKYDKISPAQAQARVDEVTQLVSTYSHCVGVIPFSSETRHNRDKLIGIIGSVVAR
jgi:GTP-binding protein